jgi:hypothetical protein
VKNSLLLFFLLWYVAAFTEVGEILRLPIMVNHYLTHRATNTTSGIFNFMLMHYGSADEKDADEKQDQQLPFKSVEQGGQFVFLEAPSIELMLPNDLLHLGDDFFPMIQSSYAFRLPWGIWHPPRTSVS